MRLYHYTCHHTRKAIGTRGMLRPSPTAWGGPPVLWLTPLDVPDRYGLGLTSSILKCDRMDFRYVVDGAAAVPWLESPLRVPLACLMLEVAPVNARPETWWVSEQSALGVLDRGYKKPIAASEASC